MQDFSAIGPDDYDQAYGTWVDHNQQEQRRAWVYNRASEAFDSGLPLVGTLAETYLVSGRGIPFDPNWQDLHFCSGFYHSKEVGALPAMVAAMRPMPGGPITAIQATFLAPDGLTKTAAHPARKVYGTAKGSAVWLTNKGQEMAIAESIEKALAIGSAIRLPVVSAYSAGNLVHVNPPPGCKKWIIAADRGELGEAKARAAAQRLIEGA